MTYRTGIIERETNETSVKIELTLDGEGIFTGGSQIGFFDHMLTLLAKHSGFSLVLSAKGDLEVDSHHLVEDIGICLGQAFNKALLDKRGIARYSSLILPMDEVLVMCAVDVSGRPGFYPQFAFSTDKIGEFDSQLVEEFWRAFTMEARITLHIQQLAGKNSHHVAEAIFKGAGQVLKGAVTLEGQKIPSSKGAL